MTKSARVRAFAKLNLGLKVLYKRPDGYHELRTVFQTVSLCDTLGIEFTRTRATRIEVRGTPEIPDNLVTKAAWMVVEALKIQADIQFQLNKKIPAGAGLGGGSSDAAAVLLALPVLAGKFLPLDQLSAMAGQLGSDVPFFLHGGTALGLGRGEELYPLPPRRARGLIVAPDVHSSTAEAYRGVSAQLTTNPSQNKLVNFQQGLWNTGSARGEKSMVDNDFEPVVFARNPELKSIKRRLLRQGATTAAMTGSGSALFGIFADAEKLHRASKSFPNERVFPVSFLSRTQFRSAWTRALRNYLSPETIEHSLWPPRSEHV